MTRVIKDYSKDRKVVEPIEIPHGGDVFLAVGVAPGGTIADLAAVTNAESDLDQLQAIYMFFDHVLLPESADLFADRLRDPENPITTEESMSIFADLVKIYTSDEVDEEPDRPTPRASGSPRTAKKTSAGSSGRAASKASTSKEVASATP